MKTRQPHDSAGFSLVEVTLALGIAAFCLVTVFGLLPVGVNSNRASFEQTAAANVASVVVADLQSASAMTSGGALSSPLYQLPVPATPSAGRHTLFLHEDGTASGAIDQNADPASGPRYRVTIYYTAAGTVGGTAANPNALNARVLITWPALADGTASAEPSHFAGSFETFTGFVGR